MKQKIRKKPKFKIGVLYQGLWFALIILGMVGASYLYGTSKPSKTQVQNLEEKFHQKDLDKILSLGLVQPECMYKDANTLVIATGKGVELLIVTTDRESRVGTSSIIAMAGMESGWGTSRFA